MIRLRNINPGLLFLVLVVVAAVVVMGVSLLTANRSSSVVIQLITPVEYREQYALPAKPHFLLDVRTPEEFATGHIAEAVNISVDELQSRLSEVPHDVPVIVYCRSGNRSATAAKILKDAGYTSIYDLGGIAAWIAQGMPVIS
ncbi:MAG: rhodanese-like domain-containing protein [Anaerolineae bacterium]|nr:rhodanese-like domain-containing protein [Anaerolineae bacterium]